MDPTDDFLEGISQGTLDWINEMFALFHSSHEPSSTRIDGDRSTFELTESNPTAKIPATLESDRDEQRGEVYISRILEPSFEFEHDAPPRSLVHDATYNPQGSSSRSETRQLSLETQLGRQSSSSTFRFPPTVAPTTPSTTPQSPGYVRHTSVSTLPKDGVRSMASPFHELQTFDSHGIAYPTPSQTRRAVPEGMGAHVLPSGAISGQFSQPSGSNWPFGPANSTPSSQSYRGARPRQHLPNLSPDHRLTEPTPRRLASTIELQRRQSAPISAPSTNRSPLVQKPREQPTTSHDRRQTESTPRPPLLAPQHTRTYLPATGPSLPGDILSGAAQPPTRPLRKKEEPVEQSSLQSVFRAVPDRSVPARATALEKNRLAARKSRTKKRDHIEDLASQSREYAANNKRLRERVGELTDEVNGLRNIIRQHRHCGGWTDELQSGVDSYLRRVDERQEKEEIEAEDLAMDPEEDDHIEVNNDDDDDDDDGDDDGDPVYEHVED